MIHLYENGLEVLKKRIKSDKLELYWDNYDIVMWEKNNNGFYDKSGKFRNNSWGIASVISVSQDGTWKLPKKYVKYFK